MDGKVKALFGFTPALPPFDGLAVEDQAALIASWGANAVFGGYQDAAFVAAAHAAGLKVYAEFGCFFGGEELWRRLPASRPITASGETLEPEGGYYGANPSLPELRQERLAALEQLARDHPVDGVWLDFIRWPGRWESPHPRLARTSFDPATVARFSADTGIALPPGDVPTVARDVLGRYAEEWVEWRCEQITSWVAAAKAALGRLQPGALLGLFGVPWRLNDYDGAILRIMGQDYRTLGRLVDVFSPMVYHRMCGQPPSWIHDVTAEVHRMSDRPVGPIIQSVDEPDVLSADEYGQALDVALDSPSSAGVIVFTLAGMLEGDRLAATQARFSLSA
ncbi:MAG: hypothetical protein GX601_10095 [Anaerolineales bacterium]|nr:hypothetical protein [Anaerolineales bacterium]